MVLGIWGAILTDVYVSNVWCSRWYRSGVSTSLSSMRIGLKGWKNRESRQSLENKLQTWARTYMGALGVVGVDLHEIGF